MLTMAGDGQSKSAIRNKHGVAGYVETWQLKYISPPTVGGHESVMP